MTASKSAQTRFRGEMASSAAETNSDFAGVGSGWGDFLSFFACGSNQCGGETVTKSKIKLERTIKLVSMACWPPCSDALPRMIPLTTIVRMHAVLTTGRMM